MAEVEAPLGELATAERLVGLLEQDGFRLDVAVWVPESEGHGRLYLVPEDHSESTLRQMIRVASVISEHKDELPGRHDLLYSVVDARNPIVQAISSVSRQPGKVRGAYKDGTYIDTAYVLRPAA